MTTKKITTVTGNRKQERNYQDLKAISRRVALDVLNEERTAIGLCKAAHGAGLDTDYIVAQFAERAPADQRPACKEGCDSCCYLYVEATAPEVLLIAEYLRHTLTPEELDVVRQRVAALDEKTRGMNSYERLAAPQPCALLVDRRCSAYPARPIYCRGYCSSTPHRCQEAVGRPYATTIAFKPGMEAAWAASESLREALSQIGLSGVMLEFTAALRVALALPDAAERYLRGEKVFADAKPVPHAAQKPLRTALRV